jgi:hypothetical protein
MMQQLLAAACAIGVAGNFGAPFGGLLFSIEVTSTYVRGRRKEEEGGGRREEGGGGRRREEEGGGRRKEEGGVAGNFGAPFGGLLFSIEVPTTYVRREE